MNGMQREGFLDVVVGLLEDVVDRDLEEDEGVREEDGAEEVVDVVEIEVDGGTVEGEEEANYYACMYDSNTVLE